MNELISVIINVYNGEKYIAKCIESIINQTYKNLEILIVNDGSTDNTLKICESYKDKRIRIINQKNMGISLARNVGIENAKGEYLFFIDSDDFVELDILEYLYNLCKKNNTLMAVSTPIDIYNYNYKVKNKKEKVEVISGIDFVKKILLAINRTGNVWNKLMKKELFNEIRFENRIIDDTAIIYKIVLLANKIAYSNQIKYYYFRHSDSIMGRKESEYSINLYKVVLERYDYLKNNYPNLIENEIGSCYIIMILYLDENEEVKAFLKEQDAYQVFKKMFTLKVLTCKMKFRNKMKIILLRINPKLCKFMVNKYLKLKSLKNKNKELRNV